MKHSQNLNTIELRSYAVRDDITCVWHDQLSRTVNASDMAKGRVVGKTIDGVKNTLNNKLCRSGIVLGNVICFVIEVLQRLG